MKEYTPVTRRDLRGFDREATELILTAQSAGLRVKVSKRNHAILMGPKGGTTAVPMNMKHRQRTSQNSYAAVARLLRETEG